MKRAGIAGLALLAVISLAGCSGYRNPRGTGDSPVQQPVNSNPAEVVEFPDGFMNVADKCDGHGHRVFVVTHTNNTVTPFVINDKTCPGGSE